MEGRPLQEAWAVMTQAAQRGHLLGSKATFPLEVEQSPWGDSARALVQGLSAFDTGLCTRHAGLRGALTWKAFWNAIKYPTLRARPQEKLDALARIFTGHHWASLVTAGTLCLAAR